MKSSNMRMGAWLSIGSPVIAELAALSGFDWVLLDLEHGCESESALPNQLRALRGSETRGIVRVSAPEPGLIARVLDWGAHGIMVPHVNSAIEAESVVKSAYYAPRGHRGFSRTVRLFDYGLHPPGDLAPHPLIMAQIESLAGVSNAADIAAVEGIDVLFVGPADLQLDLKHQCENVADEYAACLRKVIMSSRNSNKEAGILVRNLADVPQQISLGFTHIAIDSDIAILRNAYQQTLANLRSHR